MAKLTEQQQATLEALVEAPSVPAAASLLGIKPKELRKQLWEDATLYAAWRLANRCLAEEAFARLVKGGAEAAEELAGIIVAKDLDRSDATRLRACEAIFALVEGYLARLDVADRLERLEALAAALAERGVHLEVAA